MGAVAPTLISTRCCANHVQRMPKRSIIKHGDVRHVENEKSILQLLNRSTRPGAAFILRLLGTAQDAGHIYLVTEYAPGGDLFRRLSRVGRFSTKAVSVRM